jgi:hypothetical protein
VALTKYNFNSFDVTTAASTGLGFNASANGFSTISSTSMVLIKTLTASSSSNLTFVHGSSDVVLDSTYPVYLFKYINLHPATDGQETHVNFTTDGTNFNVTKTSTVFDAEHNEDDGYANLSYNTAMDLAQGTGDQQIGRSTANDNDSCISGELFLFNPSSTTFVKHYIAKSSEAHTQPRESNFYIGGYCNTTSAVTGVRFDFGSGNIDAGTIKLYGIKDS